ncbi:MAG: 30S ribosome-binding factor RbfA [Elusimicrobiota bacterium]
MQSYKRSVRVAELIQQEISKIIQELKNPGLGFVTITGVKLTDDLQDARIFYSVIGSDKDISDTKDILERSIPEIRHLLAMRINLRRTPVLTLVFDDTAKRANRIFEILEKIRSEENGPIPELPVEAEPETKAKTIKNDKTK